MIAMRRRRPERGRRCRQWCGWVVVRVLPIRDGRLPCHPAAFDLDPLGRSGLEHRGQLGQLGRCQLGLLNRGRGIRLDSVCNLRDYHAPCSEIVRVSLRRMCSEVFRNCCRRMFSELSGNVHQRFKMRCQGQGRGAAKALPQHPRTLPDTTSRITSGHLRASTYIARHPPPILPAEHHQTASISDITNRPPDTTLPNPNHWSMASIRYAPSADTTQHTPHQPLRNVCPWLCRALIRSPLCIIAYGPGIPEGYVPWTAHGRPDNGYRDPAHSHGSTPHVRVPMAEHPLFSPSPGKMHGPTPRPRSCACDGHTITCCPTKLRRPRPKRPTSSAESHWETFPTNAAMFVRCRVPHLAVHPKS